jgi:hypothetical protein
MAATLFALAVPVAAQQSALRQSPPDSLWQKAVEIAGRNQNWVPGLLVTSMAEVDGEGNAKSVRETRMRVFLGEDGEIDSEILKCTDDGEDVTEEARKEAAEEKLKEEKERRKREEKRKKEAEKKRTKRQKQELGAAAEDEDPEENDSDESQPENEPKGRFSLGLGGPSPFNPEVQDSVTFKRVEAKDPPPGGPYVAYEFVRQTPSGTSIAGTAWLDAATGMPVEMRFAPDPLPKRVKELSMTMRFETRPDSSWVPAEMHIEAMGKFLFFKKRFHNTLAFSDHWWLEESRESSPAPPDTP